MPARRRFRFPDGLALTMLLGLTAIVAWNRADFDSWLTRYDMYTQFLPWYEYLGDRVARLDAPGWNPHLLSGTPFAGHPMSGWMYFPAMAIFAFFPELTGFKVMMVTHLVIAGLSTYAFGRVLGMGVAAALVSAMVFEFGPFLEWNTYTSLQFGQFAAWIPLLLLGIELAIRADTWGRRLVPWCMAGIATCQMFVGWVGEGWIYALLLAAGYTGYRAFLSQPLNIRWRERLTIGVTTGLAVPVLGIALGAAGIWPRLAVNAQTSLAGGDYSDLGGDGILNPPWDLDYMLIQIMGMGTGYHHRAAGLGGAVLVLALLAPVFARRRYAVPFFAVITVVALMLTLHETPLHQVFYLMPRYQELHEHDPWRVFALATIGPAVMSGAVVDSVGRFRGRLGYFAIVFLPLLAMIFVTGALNRIDGVEEWPPLIAASAVTAALLLIIAIPPDPARRWLVGWMPKLGVLLIILAIFAQPTGLELTGSWLGWPEDQRWENEWIAHPGIDGALDIEVSERDIGGAGEFLHDRMDEIGPVRYLAYGGVWYPDAGHAADAYSGRGFDPNIQGILDNGRPMFLDLYGIQGYDPNQLARYVEFMTALNGTGQNYHWANVLHTGVASPLLDLLAVRYVLLDATLPPDRDDVQALTGDLEEVFRANQVIVYENPQAFRHAWIVHDVQSVERGETLPLLTDGSVDFRKTALVEGEVSDLQPATDPSKDRAFVVGFGPDAVTIDTSTDAPGFLVVSEIHADGWRAYVDGDPVDILPTNHALRGVPIPAGEHTVKFRYQPVSLEVGVPITKATGVLMLGVFVVAGWQRVRSWRPLIRLHRRR